MQEFLLLVLSLAHLSASPRGEDVKLALNEEARGGYDVKTFTRILRSKSFVIDDNNFWRHVYYAKSDDRTDGVNLHGRTMKIDRKTFLSTQNCHLPAIKVYCKLILTKLNIDWTRVSFSDLRSPLYSGLAAVLYSLLQHKDTTATHVDTITEANPEPIIKGSNETLAPALPKNSINVRGRRSISTPVRLVNGGFPGEGRIEVFYNGTWGTVCDDGFDVNDARVICSMLGYTGEQPIPRESAFYGAGTGTILLDDLACLGTESSVFSCRPYTVGTHNCGHIEDVGVNCQPLAPSHDIQLTNGTYPWEGRVEVWYKGEWGTICSDHFDVIDAVVVCSMLGFQSVPTVDKALAYGPGTGLILLDEVNCTGGEKNIYTCSHRGLGVHNCDHYKDIGINCQPTSPIVPVKLTNGSFPWEGRVEVWYGGSWSSVCKHNFDAADAEVICNMLEFTGGQPSVYSTNGESFVTTTVWKDIFNCRSTERGLFQCLLRDINHTCDHRDLTAVNCLPDAPTPSLRLAWGVNRWEGRLEIWYNGSWEPVCPDNFEVNDTQRVCGILGYTGGYLSSEDNETILLNDIKCKGSHHSLMFCNLGVSSCSNDSTVFINCNIFSSENDRSSNIGLVYYVGGGALGAIFILLLINVFVMATKLKQANTRQQQAEQNEMESMSLSDRLNPKESGKQPVQAVPNTYVFNCDASVPDTLARAPVFPSELADVQVTDQTDDSVYINAPDDGEMDVYENEVFNKY